MTIVSAYTKPFTYFAFLDNGTEIEIRVKDSKFRFIGHHFDPIEEEKIKNEISKQLKL